MKHGICCKSNAPHFFILAVMAMGCVACASPSTQPSTQPVHTAEWNAGYLVGYPDGRAGVTPQVVVILQPATAPTPAPATQSVLEIGPKFAALIPNSTIDLVAPRSQLASQVTLGSNAAGTVVDGHGGILDALQLHNTVFYLWGADSFTIRNLTLNGQKGALAFRTHCPNVTIDHCTLNNFSGALITEIGTKNFAFTNNTVGVVNAGGVYAEHDGLIAGNIFYGSNGESPIRTDCGPDGKGGLIAPHVDILNNIVSNQNDETKQGAEYRYWQGTSKGNKYRCSVRAGQETHKPCPNAKAFCPSIVFDSDVFSDPDTAGALSILQGCTARVTNCIFEPSACLTPPISVNAESIVTVDHCTEQTYSTCSGAIVSATANVLQVDVQGQPPKVGQTIYVSTGAQIGATAVITKVAHPDAHYTLTLSTPIPAQPADQVLIGQTPARLVNQLVGVTIGPGNCVVVLPAPPATQPSTQPATQPATQPTALPTTMQALVPLLPKMTPSGH